MPRFVPTDPGIECLTPHSLRSFIEVFGSQIPEVRQILLDHWPSSSKNKRKPQILRPKAKNSPSADTFVQNNVDQVRTTCTLSTTPPLLPLQIRDPVEAERRLLSDRPILATESAGDEDHTNEVPDCKQEDVASLNTEDSTIDYGEEDIASPICGEGKIETSKPKSRGSWRDLSQVNVDDMDCATRHDRLRSFRIMIERDGQLTGKNATQYAELVAKGTRVHRRDLSKMSVSEMTTRTKSVRRSVLKKKIQRGDALNQIETKQAEELGI